MTTYRCRKCPLGANGKPVYHPGLWACPKEGAFDAGKVARYKARREEVRRAQETPAPGGAPMPGTAPAPPASGGGSSSVLQRVELGTQIAETARRDEQQKQADADWILPAESSVDFFNTIRNALRMFAHWLDDILEAKKTPEGEIKDSIFEMNSHDLAAAGGGFGRRLATKVVKGLGAKTLEEGIATVDTLAFGVMFGGMFLGMIGHFIKVAPDSPRLKKLKEYAAKRREAAEARRLAANEKAKLTEAQKSGATTATARSLGTSG